MSMFERISGQKTTAFLFFMTLFKRISHVLITNLSLKNRGLIYLLGHRIKKLMA